MVKCDEKEMYFVVTNRVSFFFSCEESREGSQKKWQEEIKGKLKQKRNVEDIDDNCAPRETKVRFHIARTRWHESNKKKERPEHYGRPKRFYLCT